MLVERLKFLQESGRVHFFNIGESKFLYSRENNHTYYLEDDLYACLSTELTTETQTLPSVRNLFHRIKNDIKPVAEFYLLLAFDSSNLLGQIERIKQTCFTFIRSEVVVNEANPGGDKNDILELASRFNDMTTNEIAFIHEKDMLLCEKHERDSIDNNSLVKILYNVSSQSKIPNLAPAHSQLKIEYTVERETDISKLVSQGNGSVSLYIKNGQDSSQFLNFLLPLLRVDPAINRGLQNFYTIAKFLLSDVSFSLTTEIYNNRGLNNANNAACNKCWAKNICWATRSFSSFNIDLLNVNGDSVQCNSIRTLIENIILKLHTIEVSERKKTNRIYEFEGVGIKLIN